MSGLYFICGLLGLSVATPFLLFELGKCHMRRELIKNIRELEKMKENSNEEISAIIDIHFEELKKLDMFYKEK
tara:strand:+ start:9973 stop:10191 length:219 start_codon:yes stop_codon:yes gene_type:complete